MKSKQPFAFFAAAKTAHSLGEKVTEDAIISLLQEKDLFLNLLIHEFLLEIGNEDTILKLYDIAEDNSNRDLSYFEIISALQDKCMIYNPALT